MKFIFVIVGIAMASSSTYAQIYTCSCLARMSRGGMSFVKSFDAYGLGDLVTSQNTAIAGCREKFRVYSESTGHQFDANYAGYTCQITQPCSCGNVRGG